MATKILLLLAAFVCVLVASQPRAAATAQPYRVALPLVANGGPRGALGVEISGATAAQGLGPLSAGWVRRNGLRWSDVEPAPGGAYRWDAPTTRALEAQLAAAGRLGLRVILVVHGSPTWAVAPHRVNCAPVAAAARDDFARFVAAAVRRYSAPPYNVKYWEIGNEPDAFLFTADSPYGCWGQPDQALYGGQAYGELLKAVYPAIKAADPGAVVLNGGLLLDRPFDPQSGGGRSARFLEGVLAAGAGRSFDILAYHSYSYYDGTADGGVSSDWKPAYLRQILARSGLTKPLLNTEGALLCATPSAACAEAQAHAMGRLAVRALRDGLYGYVWYIYDSDSFRSTALVDPANPARRRPAHAGFAQAAAALAGHSYAAQLTGLPAGVEGHRLEQAGRSTIVIWANQPTPVQLSLGAGAQPRCAEWDGAALACPADSAGRLALSAVPGPRYISVPRP